MKTMIYGKKITADSVFMEKTLDFMSMEYYEVLRRAKIERLYDDFFVMETDVNLAVGHNVIILNKEYVVDKILCNLDNGTNIAYIDYLNKDYLMTEDYVELCKDWDAKNELRDKEIIEIKEVIKDKEATKYVGILEKIKNFLK